MSVLLPVVGARRPHPQASSDQAACSRPQLQNVLCWSDISIFYVLYFLNFSITKTFNEKLK